MENEVQISLRLYKENKPTAKQAATTTQTVCSPLSGCCNINIDQLRDSISMLTAHKAECGGKCTLKGETMHSCLDVIMQASCIKCGHVFSIKTSPRAQNEQWQTVDSQLGCSSQRTVYWRRVDTLEFHTCTHGRPWYAQTNVF